ncbi:hypothetical protein ASG90_06875 [Nocardioides sp. Soil797]|nr:hypothetical protein ASG90_06875 [Nocardioides sp. Soil797]
MTLETAPTPLVPDAPGEIDAGRLGRLNLLWHVIADLREVTDIGRLIDMAPVAICRLGFERAMISRVEHSAWLVQRFHNSSDPAMGEAITKMAQENPPALARNLFEADIVRRRRALLVGDAQNDPRVQSELAVATQSTSYVAAPIMPDGEVIGLLHADRPTTEPAMDGFDRELLALFAAQFGQVLERAVLITRLDTLKSRVNEMTHGLAGLVDGCLEGTTDMEMRIEAAGAARGALPATVLSQLPGHDPDDALTRREIDVLKLMAAGDTNARIASRLVISEGTVKSHVRHILRKLNAANRAEAVCRWLQAEARSA